MRRTALGRSSVAVGAALGALGLVAGAAVGCGPVVETGGGGGNTPPCGPEMHLIGVYETHGGHSAGNHPPGAATVHVERKGTMILALSSYEPVHWTVTADPGVTLEKVILNGYHEQTADVPAGVPVEDHSFETTGSWLGSCAYVWPDSGGGCDAEQVAASLESMTGRDLSTFHGCYQAQSFTLHDDLTVSGTCAVDQGYELSSEVFLACQDDPGPCDGAQGTGLYKGYMCEDSHNFILTEDITCADALENCQLNASLNPDISYHCTWNGQVIHENELTAGVCDGL